MAVRDDFSAGEVLAAADLNDTFASKADYPSGGSNGDLLTKSGTTTAWATPSASGLIKITDTSWSAVSSVSVASCFTSTYDIYRIVMRITECSNDSMMFFRLRTGAGSDVTSNYINKILGLNGNESNTGQNAFRFHEVDSGNNNASYFDVIEVNAANLAVPTTFLTHSGHYDAAGNYNTRVGAAINTNNTAYPSFSILPETGTFSGNLVVYGYVK